MIDFIRSENGFYIVAFILAIGVGLIPATLFKRGKVSIALLTIVVLVAALAYSALAPWAALIYVATFTVVRVLLEVHDLSSSPLLIDEPYWRKVSLLITHQRAIRGAAAEQARETV